MGSPSRRKLFTQLQLKRNCFVFCLDSSSEEHQQAFPLAVTKPQSHFRVHRAFKGNSYQILSLNFVVGDVLKNILSHRFVQLFEFLGLEFVGNARSLKTLRIMK